jgi:hypothetical protein
VIFEQGPVRFEYLLLLALVRTRGNQYRTLSEQRAAQ